jgi:four helix bundle protein
MKTNNIIVEKSFSFAIRIVNLYKHLNKNKKEFVLSNQILRSGTSVGANVNEVICGISKKDFLAKMYIAYKEIIETIYWIELLYKTEYLTEKEYTSILSEASEISKILSSITKTTRMGNS